MTHNVRVLVVDDDEAIAAALKAVLDREGYCSAVASSGNDCLKALSQENFDVVILDFYMPGLNGFDVIKLIKQGHPNVHVIAISGQGSMKNALNMLQYNALDFLSKPLNIEFLLSLLSNLRTQGHQSSLVASPTQCELIGDSPGIRQVKATIQKIAPSNANILILGETGTGKEVVAQKIHMQSTRHLGPFVPVNCSALPEHLLESELFGYEKGAFTGAIGGKDGLFDAANQGTLFLDEIGEISPAMQAKLLRVVETKRFRRLGSVKEQAVDIRILSATNRKLVTESEKGSFRKDLYYRLSAITIQLPPLRQRKEDIPALVEFFIKKLNPIKFADTKIEPDVMESLMAYSWPGNVRELQNVLENMLVIGGEKPFTKDALPDHLRPGSFELVPAHAAVTNDVGPIETVERKHIEKVLKECRGHRAWASSVLGISERALYYKIKKYRLGL